MIRLWLAYIAPWSYASSYKPIKPLFKSQNEVSSFFFFFFISCPLFYFFTPLARSIYRSYCILIHSQRYFTPGTANISSKVKEPYNDKWYTRFFILSFFRYPLFSPSPLPFFLVPFPTCFRICPSFLVLILN